MEQFLCRKPQAVNDNPMNCDSLSLSASRVTWQGARRAAPGIPAMNQIFTILR
jgi:hypothetical protein